MSEQEKVYVYIQSDPESELGLSGAAIRRISEAMKKIKNGEKVDLKKLYNTQKK